MTSKKYFFWPLIFFLTAGCAWAGSAPADGYNLLLITLDTTRADHLGCYGHAGASTPSLDALARGGVRFASSYTPVPLTLPAHCSLFTGLNPIGHAVRNNASYLLPAAQDTMAELFKQKGFHTYAVVASYVLMAKFGLGQGFDFYDDSLNPADMSNNFASEIGADSVYEKFRVWFARSFQKRFFAWVHFYDPHLPYAPPAPFSERFKKNPYDGEIAYMDSVIGRILSDLKSKNILEKTVVVVAGDHGEDLGEHEEYGHGVFCYEESLRVPLIVSCPRLFDPRVVSQRVSLIDVLPTVCGLFGIAPGPGFQGISLERLLKGKEDELERELYFESLYGREDMGWAPLTGILSGSYKYIHLPEAELYDLAGDPRERDNLFFKKNLIARGLNRKLQDMMLKGGGQGKESQRQLTEADRRHLAALGYLSSVGKTDKAIDPKRGNVFRNQVRMVKLLLADKRFDEAEKRLNQVIADNPDIKTPMYYEIFDEIYKETKNAQKLIASAKKAVREFPGNHQVRFNLAINLFANQNLKEAEEACQQVLASDASYTRAYILMGDIRFAQGRLPETLSFYEKALALEPQNLSLKKRLAMILLRVGEKTRALALLDELAGDERLASDSAGNSLLAEVATQFFENGEPDRAIALFRLVLQRNPKDAKTWNDLGSAYFKQRDLDQARESYEKAMAADTAFALSYSNLGALHLALALRQKDPNGLEQAHRYFDQAIERDSGLASAYNGRATARRYLRRVPEALDDWKKALELAPEMIEPYFNLGITYLESGDRAEALKYFRRCQEKMGTRLAPGEKSRLQRLIAEAEKG